MTVWTVVWFVGGDYKLRDAQVATFANKELAEKFIASAEDHDVNVSPWVVEHEVEMAALTFDEIFADDDEEGAVT